MSVQSKASLESRVNKFADNLGDLPENMRLFSLSLRSLYSVNDMGSGSDAAIKVTKLRDDTRRDAMVYVKGVLPLSVDVIQSIQGFFEYYEGLTQEEWNQNLPDILTEVKGYKDCCTEITKMHEKIMIPLKKRQDEATTLMSELENLTERYRAKVNELQDSASTKKKWAIALAFIPVVNVIASPILGISADSDLADSAADEQQSEITESVVCVIGNTMSPALAAFIDGLNAAAGFFSVIENEITAFLKKGDAAVDNAKKLHYIMMKKKAAVILTNCREFYAMLPEVRTDLGCIPEPDDKNYVDKWLAKQKEEIRKKYGTLITAALRQLINQFTTNDLGQRMIKH